MTDTTKPFERERVLAFGDDGSANADVAWLWVCNHAWPKWRADVLTAFDPFGPTATHERPAEFHEWQSPHPRLLMPHTALAAIRSLRIEQDPRLMLEGRGDADLIIIGPRSVGHRRGLALGSTTEWLLHHPPAPLAVIRSATPTHRVLICIDGSHHAKAALQAYLTLPWAATSEVVVLGVNDKRTGPGAAVEEAVNTLRVAGISAQGELHHGQPTDIILERIDELAPHLVVLGTRGFTGWKRLRLGSTASAVVRASHANSLIACAPDAQ